ncbi:GntR family transcriptional regulator [Streptosporangium sp. NPDC051022]|uniref:GntR family transcriptional regulator n=1 Tax=Streptosporangium sp. NPDC051022 TaxID=3155752 RepID=UPI0034319CFD
MPTRHDGVRSPGSPERNLSYEVYSTLRNEIVRGVLRPNEAVVEADIADRLGVSRTPVRESLQRLASDGLIVSRRRRWVVYERSREEIAELYEVRAALESHAARLAALRASDEQIAALRELTRRVSGGVDGLSGPERVEANECFHDLVIRSSANDRLVAEIHRNRLYAFNHQVVAGYTREQLRESWHQHEEIVEAVAARDATRAGEATRRHIEHALSMILRQVF